MNTPVSYRLNTIVDSDRVAEWATDNDMFDRMSYDWIKRVITFENDEDATAFSLRFDINRFETKIDKMIRNEEDYY